MKNLTGLAFGGRTHDWVAIYYERDGPESQFTVVTEHQGPLKNQPVVRGREAECLQLRRAHGASQPDLGSIP